MDDINSSFKFGASNGESPDRILKAGSDDKKISRLNRKIMFIAFLVPCFIGIILYFAYRDIQNESLTLQKTGSQEIKKISKNIETQFASMSEIHKTSEIAFNKKILSIEKATSSLNNTLVQTNKKLKKFTLSKAGKKETEAKLKKIKQLLASIEDDTKSVASKLYDFDATVSAEFLKMKKNFKKVHVDLIALKTEMSDLSSSKADIKKLDGLLENHLNLIDKKINFMKKEVDKRFLSYDEKIKNVRCSGKDKEPLHSDLSKKKSNIQKSNPDETGRYDNGIIYEENIK